MLGEIEVTEGLPGDFAEFFRGSIAFHRGETNAARAIWKALLIRPKDERQLRSTWSAYMLGRTCGPDESDEAISYYTQVRALAKEGFADSLGLAAASLGWEAKAELDRKDFEKSIELYLQQLTTGDSSVESSLRFAARSALDAGAETLTTLAANSRTRRVLTAFVIARGPVDPALDNGNKDGVTQWLEAVEAAGVKDVESAEQFALAAYQNGQMEVAERWIALSHDSPVSQWLQAKLLLRAGKVEQAARLLSRVVKRFPIERETNKTSNITFQDTLTMNLRGCWPEEMPVSNQVLGELGVLRLARHEYQESLDALLRSGYWMDAAYVAERILSTDELKAYVDRHWPAAKEEKPDQTVASEKVPGSEQAATSQNVREEIRHLLARRLMRGSRGAEAREYFPAALQPRYDSFMRGLATGRDASLAVEPRAAALFEAAKIARHEGMELLGTEVAPDWAVRGGDWESDMTAPNRATNSSNTLLIADEDELKLYAAHDTTPDARFQYRYQAAYIAWEAAQLMSDNSDETAKVLWTAGCWLKNRDPKTADTLYKALVNRCRKTALGEEADRIRWFPTIDEQGNIIPGKSRVKKTIDEAVLPAREESGEAPAIPIDPLIR
ncbi:MAG: hypothetical protein JWR26_515 [Pedosphaera sp.]|nr:hypothetical protein [Pedosphaera sp.]